jgi:hypothetical protein
VPGHLSPPQGHLEVSLVGVIRRVAALGVSLEVSGGPYTFFTESVKLLGWWKLLSAVSTLARCADSAHQPGMGSPFSRTVRKLFPDGQEN